jgi:phenylacetate-CoA ligase
MLEWAYGGEPKIAINAFSMGAWATGVNMGEALELHSVVKSTGPDLEKILHTLEFFGPKPSYFICGYPPFLKLVLDSMLQRGFALERYELHALVGGEGMSEGLRRYLLRYFRSCYSGYGASDLQMGIAIETPESVWIRGLLNDHPTLRASLLGGDHRVPMVFQYNPVTHHIETNSENEIIVTLNYSRILSSRIRYNIGDEGLLFTRRDLLQHLRDSGFSPDTANCEILDLPYLLLFGRRDQTISIMGANIYPEDVERAVFAQEELAAGFASFMISVENGVNGTVSPKLCIEWGSERPPELPLQALSTRIGQSLAAINADFRTAVSEYAGALKFELCVYGAGQGPFAGRGRKIKNRYLHHDHR